MGLMVALGVSPEDSEPLARAHYKDETTLGYTPWPGDNKAVKWQPHENPDREQRVLLMCACWRLLTGAELSGMKELKTAEITVRFDFEAGYDWPKVELKGRKRGQA